MQTKDIHSLLEQAISDGFTFDFISKAAGVPVNLIQCCYDSGSMTQSEIQNMSQVLDFLVSLYMVDTTNSTYLKDSVEALEQRFGFTHTAIANYLGVSEPYFNAFLDKPSDCPDRYTLSLKFMHFRSVLLQGH